MIEVEQMPKQTYPEPTVGALIFNPAGELFLMRSHKWKDMYVVPGGHIELGERMVDALIREVKEETDLDVYDIEFLCFQEFVYNNSFWKQRHFIFFDYVCRTDTTNARLNSEAQSYIWVEPENALNLPIDTYTQRAIREYLKSA
jgi:nucleoside triphosphatase